MSGPVLSIEKKQDPNREVRALLFIHLAASELVVYQKISERTLLAKELQDAWQSRYFRGYMLPARLSTAYQRPR